MVPKNREANKKKTIHIGEYPTGFNLEKKMCFRHFEPVSRSNIARRVNPYNAIYAAVVEPTRIYRNKRRKKCGKKKSITYSTTRSRGSAETRLHRTRETTTATDSTTASPSESMKSALFSNVKTFHGQYVYIISSTV